MYDDEYSNSLGLPLRQYQTLRLTALGYQEAEIAELLFVTINTVKTNRREAYGKTGITAQANNPNLEGSVKSILALRLLLTTGDIIQEDLDHRVRELRLDHSPNLDNKSYLNV